MKFVLFGDGGRLGLLEGESILDLHLAVSAYQSRIGAPADPVAAVSSLPNLIAAGPHGLDLVRAAADGVRGLDLPGLRVDIGDTTLAAPFPGQRMMMAGVNFAEHVSDYLTHMGSPITPEAFRAKARKGEPSGFWSVARPIMGPGARIQIPSKAEGYFDYEAEPAIVLARTGKDIQLSDADSYVWGVSLAADWTIRETWPPKPMNGLMVRKNFDCSKSFGPCIVVDEGIDLNDLRISTAVNGQLRQDFSTRDMIFSFAEMLEFISRDFTIFPGDVMTGGTSSGTAIDTVLPDANGDLPLDLFLKPGDIVGMSSPAIGLLSSRIVAKTV